MQSINFIASICKGSSSLVVKKAYSATGLARHISQPLLRPQMNKDLVQNMSGSGPIYQAKYLSEKIRKALEAEHVDIEDLSNCGCGMKFDAVIVSAQFDGKPILQRQRIVNQLLTEEMKHIHAFTMRTLTPTQWKEIQSKQEQGRT